MKNKYPVVPGEIYHVFNRGVDKRTVFKDKEDYLRFYESLDLFNNTESVVNLYMARLHRLDNKDKLVNILSYCLLPNHYHLLISPVTDDGLSQFMRRLGTGYTNYFNEKYNRSGALFQGKYKRVLVETEEQLNYLFAYVNENHAVHGLNAPDEVLYSSKLHFTGAAKSRLIDSVDHPIDYSLGDAQALAVEIYENRTLAKSVVFE